MDSQRLDEWVIVLEFVPGSSSAPIDYEAIHDVVDELRAWQPTGLFAPDRYALQLRVPAERPMEAVRRALTLHSQAIDTVGAPAPTLARIEILTATEFDHQWDDFASRPSAPAPVSRVLSDDIYSATRAMLRAGTPSEVTNILVSFVLAVGGEIEVGAADRCADKVVVDLTTEPGEPLNATADAVSVAGLILEQSLPALVADARAVVARLRQGDHASDVPQPPA